MATAPNHTFRTCARQAHLYSMPRQDIAAPFLGQYTVTSPGTPGCTAADHGDMVGPMVRFVNGSLVGDVFGQAFRVDERTAQSFATECGPVRIGRVPQLRYFTPPPDLLRALPDSDTRWMPLFSGRYYR